MLVNLYAYENRHDCDRQVCFDTHSLLILANFSIMLALTYFEHRISEQIFFLFEKKIIPKALM